MRLVEVYRQILLENLNPDVIQDRLVKHTFQIWKDLLERFPGEPGLDDPEYMVDEINRSTCFRYGSHICAILNKMKSSNNVIRQTKKCAKLKSACFYNSLNYMKLYDQEGVDLAWGICTDVNAIESDSLDSISQSNGRILNRMNSYKGNGILHAFLVNDKNQIIDPTLGMSYSGWTYFYEVVPRNIWKDFSHKDNDDNFDARDFADGYIAKRSKLYGTEETIQKFIKFAKSK